MFLRCERWDVDLASLRLAKYWDERVALFGPKAFLPLTPDEALRDDGTAASLGIFNALPGRDEEGRSIIWVDASSFPSAKSVVNIQIVESTLSLVLVMLYNM